MEWKEIKISDAIDIIGGGTPKTSVVEYWDGDIPWLSVKDFNDEYRTVITTEKTITHQGLINSSTKMLKKGDLIISARGTVGALAQLGKDMTFNQSCYGLRAKECSINTFIYYLLKQELKQIQSNTHGSVFDTITKETFDTLRAFLPPLPEQRAIAEILSSIDDKIELNNQMNRTLEAMAQAIFKQWFVDFEFPFDFAQGKPTLLASAPLSQRSGNEQLVPADSTALITSPLRERNGIQRSLSEAETNMLWETPLNQRSGNIRACFGSAQQACVKKSSDPTRSLSSSAPLRERSDMKQNAPGTTRSLSEAEMSSTGYKSSGGKMTDSELGPIPEGWKVGKLGDISLNKTNGIKPESLNDEIKYIGLEHMPRKSIALSQWSNADEIQSNKYMFKTGDILFGKLRPYFHKVGVAPIDGVCSTDILVINSIKEQYYGYIVNIISSEIFVDYANASSTGTKMPRTNWEYMSKYPILIPAENILIRYNGLMVELLSKIRVNILQSQTLSTLRDTLLPKLMSGELRVPEDIVKSYEEAVSDA